MPLKDCIVLNIGNTHTQMARCTNGQLGTVLRLETKAFLDAGTRTGLVYDQAQLPVLCACVVPHAAACLRERWPERQLSFLDAAMVKELDLGQITTETVGADRLANAVAALEMLKPPYMVIDCGTAISTVAVDGSGCLRGGTILPGRRMLRLALHEHTAQLPEVKLQENCPPAIGTNTEEAILAGVDLGVIGAVQFIIDNTRAELEAPGCPVLVTGGDAPYFLSNIPNLLAAPPHFTLRGLARLASRLS
jgi:pantothenate kinase type III